VCVVVCVIMRVCVCERECESVRRKGCLKSRYVCVCVCVWVCVWVCVCVVV